MYQGLSSRLLRIHGECTVAHTHISPSTKLSGTQNTPMLLLKNCGLRAALSLYLLAACVRGITVSFASTAARWEFEEGPDGWGLESADLSRISSIWLPDGVLSLRGTGWQGGPTRGSAAWIDSPNFDVPVDGTTHVVLRARFLSSCGQSDAAWKLLTTPAQSAHNFSTATAATFSVAVRDVGRWRVYSVILPADVVRAGSLCQLRFEPCEGAAGHVSVDVDWVRIVHAPSIRKVIGCAAALADDGAPLQPVPAYRPFVRRGTTTQYFINTSQYSFNNSDAAQQQLQQPSDNATLPFASTYSCRPGDTIFVSGAHLGTTPPVILIDGRECHHVALLSSETMASCVIPAHPRRTPSVAVLVRVENGETPIVHAAQPLLSYAAPVTPTMPSRPPWVANVAARGMDLVWRAPTDPWAAMSVTGYRVQWRAELSGVGRASARNMRMRGENGNSSGSSSSFNNNNSSNGDMIAWGPWGGLEGSSSRDYFSVLADSGTVESGGSLTTLNVTTTAIGRLAPRTLYQFRVAPLTGHARGLVAAAASGRCGSLVDMYGRVKLGAVEDAVSPDVMQRMLEGAYLDSMDYDDIDDDLHSVADADAPSADCAYLSARFNIIGDYSDPSPPIHTLSADFVFTSFTADSALDHGPTYAAFAPNALHWSGGEGHYGLVLVGSASIGNCNASAACCDSFGSANGGDAFALYVQAQEAVWALIAELRVNAPAAASNNSASAYDAYYADGDLFTVLDALLSVVDSASECSSSAAAAANSSAFFAPYSVQLIELSGARSTDSWAASFADSLSIDLSSTAIDPFSHSSSLLLQGLAQAAAAAGYDDSSNIAFVSRAAFSNGLWGASASPQYSHANRSSASFNQSYSRNSSSGQWVTMFTPQGTNYTQPAGLPLSPPAPRVRYDKSGRRLIPVDVLPARSCSLVCGAAAPSSSLGGLRSQSGTPLLRAAVDVWRSIGVTPSNIISDDDALGLEDLHVGFGGYDGVLHVPFRDALPTDSDVVSATCANAGEHSTLNPTSSYSSSSSSRRGRRRIKGVLQELQRAVVLLEEGNDDAADGSMFVADSIANCSDPSFNPESSSYDRVGDLRSDSSYSGSSGSSYTYRGGTDDDSRCGDLRGNGTFSPFNRTITATTTATVFPNGIAIAPLADAVSSLLLPGASPSSPCGPSLRLTPSLPSQTGAAYYGRAVQVRDGFSTTWVFRLANPSRVCQTMEGVHTHCRSRGGAGFAFVVQNWHPAVVGRGGTGLGYDGIPLAVAVEVDTFADEDMRDPHENHVSVHAAYASTSLAHDDGGFGASSSSRSSGGGTVRDDISGNSYTMFANLSTGPLRVPVSSHHDRALGHAPFKGVPELTDGVHIMRVEYTPVLSAELIHHAAFVSSGGGTVDNGDVSSSHGALSVFLDDLRTPILIVPLDLRAALDLDATHGRAWVGFTASTGADLGWQTHDILAWHFTSTRA